MKGIYFIWAGQSQKFSLTLSCWWELMIWTFLYVTEIRDSTVFDQKDWGCRRSPNIKGGEWYTGGGWFCQASLDVCAGELLGWNEVGISGKILLIRGRSWTWPFSLSILWYLCYQFIIFSLRGPSGVKKTHICSKERSKVMRCEIKILQRSRNVKHIPFFRLLLKAFLEASRIRLPVRCRTLGVRFMKWEQQLAKCEIVKHKDIFAGRFLGPRTSRLW